MKSSITCFTVVLIIIFCSASIKSLAQIDTTIGITIPKGSGGSYQQLAHALCDGVAGDQLKVNAIYNWITHNISYDVKAMEEGRLKEEDPKKVFKQRKGMCGGYSLLFAAMCKEVGIQAIVIDGYSKDWMFDDGDKLFIPRHAWNVVYIDKRWRLVDATWGAGGLTQVPGWLKRQVNKAANNPLQTSGKLKFRFSYDTAYFLSDPLTFRLRHLPSDPLWQLTDSCMPLVVFEAGEIAIRKFNQQYPVLAENRAELLTLGEMEDHARVQASAERISLYNPRFHVAKAAKNHADALDTIEANIGKSSTEASSALNTVQTNLKNAETEVGQQQKAIAVEYTALKTKNTAKNLQAKQYVASLHSDNKRMIAQCEAQIRKSGSIINTIKKKAAKADENSKEIYANKLMEIPTAKIEEPINSPALTILSDSVSNRKGRIDSMEFSIAKQQSKVTAEKVGNGNRLDSLALVFALADSALTQETINRIRMHDNYDEEVLQWNRLVKTARLQQVDSMQKDYFIAFDSLNRYYETLRKSQWDQMELYTKNLNDIERYKRKNNNIVFLSQYAAQVKAREACLSAYYQTLVAHSVYLERNKELFKQLITLYKRQEELATYMEKSEKKRKELEGKSLAKKEAFDKKENEKQKDQLKQTGKDVEKMWSMK